MTSDKKRASTTTTVSYMKTDENNQHLQEDFQPSSDLVVEDENVQLSLDPNLQLYLSQMSQKNGCWGRFFPIPFERAAQRSWWDPMFDSEVLEEQYKKSSNPKSRNKFRYAVWYMLLVSSLWFMYFMVTGILSETHHWPIFCIVLGALMVAMTLVLFLTYTDFYTNHTLLMSLAVAFVLCSISLSFVILVPVKSDPFEFPSTSDISPVGHFSICIEILMVIYTLIPLKLYMSITMGLLYSSAFEILTICLQTYPYHVSAIVIRLLSHVCIHLIGLQILIMTNVRTRNSFMKVGQSLLVRRQLESEKKLKENMIQSLMPPSVANWLLSDDENFNRNEQRPSVAESADIRSLFRPFNMNRVENVSILFADIVGFTKMSSNKSAEELVEILNNLFQRFDLLCKFHNCEKISTLGDCYYCVSGCPDPRNDHAKCCVEMGLSMIQAIKQFDQEKNEGVNMRVGVHTGTVLCGIVGTRRFKFDVWSNDVTLANRMESTGRPGAVHVSEKTLEFLHDTYLVEEGESVFGLKTFFILGRAGDRTPSYSGSFRAEARQKYANSMQLFVSAPTSSPSMSPQSRPRVLSCDTTSSYIKINHNPNMLSPDVCKIKASSLPSILDSDTEQDPAGEIVRDCAGEHAKTPTSTASSGKYSVKLKNWKIPKFLRKADQFPQKDADIDQQAPSMAITDDPPSSGGYQQVPTIIEGYANGNKKESFVSITNDGDDEKRNSIFLEEPKDTIDVKSYISQSRSDIGQYDYSPGDLNQFMRAGSYRSQYGRAPNDYAFLQRAGSNRSRRGKSPNFDFLPTERCRSATVAAGNFERPKKSLEVPGRLSNITVIEDQFTAQSMYSRKDSGIKSNSRRSSIQQLEAPPLLEHRVSGYFTSSQCSVNSPHYTHRVPGTFLDKYGCNIQMLRKQSDRQLIRCVQDNSKSRSSYFLKPPLSQTTLFFKNGEMEEEYRENVYSFSDQNDTITTLASSRYSTYFDLFVSSLVFLLVSLSLLLLYGSTKLWAVTFCCFVMMQFCGLAMCFGKVVDYSKRVCDCIKRFYRWNLFGGILVSLPLISVLINFCAKSNTTSDSTNYLYTYLLFVGIIHFCNFTQLNCWMKNFLVTILALIFLPLFLQGDCSTHHHNNNHHLEAGGQLIFDNSTSYKHYALLYKSEILMDLLLLLVLVWLLNRDFEIGYRIGFHASFTANRDKFNVQRLKNQADYLIYNIVPEHVADQLKKNAKYSENFKDVGIIFASIVNFNDLYDESYHGGKEFLRVLNELIGDFDELLDRPEFASVEKIKTIGSTFMAASGLNSEMRHKQTDRHEHLYSLMDFVLEMKKVIENFNRDLLEFNLILRIGYNFGDVTAAVIGNTKLYYDIWGDAVNIASRMDSTGLNGHVQVGEHCLDVLQKRYVFEPRGSVYVKGKDNMNVYLLQRKKTDDEIGD